MRESQDLMGVRVLAVDDSSQITALLADALCAHGALVVAAPSGQAALQLLRERDFDLMLLDLVMPYPNGWEVLRWLKTNKPAMVSQTILLTGDHFHPQTARSVGESGLQTLFKPFAINDLLAKVRGVAAGMALRLAC